MKKKRRISEFELEQFEPPEFESMWDAEHKSDKKKFRTEEIAKKIEENGKLTGLTMYIPLKLRGVKISPKGADPETILISAGYVKNGARGWIQKIDHNRRFHAYVLTTGKIMIHCDLYKKGRHISSEEGCEEEKNRIRRNFIPILEVDLKKDIYLPSEKTLSLVEQRDALHQLAINKENGRITEAQAAENQRLEDLNQEG